MLKELNEELRAQYAGWELKPQTKRALRFGVAALGPSLWRAFVGTFAVDSFKAAGFDGGLRKLFNVTMKQGGRDRATRAQRKRMVEVLPRALLWISSLWGQADAEDFARWSVVPDNDGICQERQLSTQACSRRAGFVNLPDVDGPDAIAHLQGDARLWEACRCMALEKEATDKAKAKARAAEEKAAIAKRNKEAIEKTD